MDEEDIRLLKLIGEAGLIGVGIKVYPTNPIVGGLLAAGGIYLFVGDSGL